MFCITNTFQISTFTEKVKHNKYIPDELEIYWNYFTILNRVTVAIIVSLHCINQMSCHNLE